MQNRITALIFKSVIFMSLYLASVSAEENKWSQSFSLGANITDGNTDTELYNINFDSTYQSTSLGQVKFKAGYNYGKEENTKSIDNKTAEIKYMRDMSEKCYWYGVSTYDSDKISNLDYRYTIGPGIGIKALSYEKNILNLEVGLSYYEEKYSGKSKDSGTALRLFEDYEHKFNSHARLWESLEYFVDLDDFDDYIVKGEAGVETVLTKSVNLKVVLKNVYTNQPPAANENNDTSLSALIVYNL